VPCQGRITRKSGGSEGKASHLAGIAIVAPPVTAALVRRSPSRSLERRTQPALGDPGAVYAASVIMASFP
jgi:hypothetical protein